jgi:hypothetical protein
VRSISVDTFAMTNPALTSILLWEFTQSFEDQEGKGPALSLCFIVLPIVMSRVNASTFKGTNIRTGFLTWLTRHPEITLHLPSQIEDTRELTRDALRFGVANRLFTVSTDGTLSAYSNAIQLSRRALGDDLVRMIQIASHLGHWTRNLPEATVFFSIGMTP